MQYLSTSNVNRKDLEKKGAIKIPADLAYTKYQREQSKMKRLSIAGDNDNDNHHNQVK